MRISVATVSAGSVDIEFARSSRRRANEVRRGGPQPSRYRQVTQRMAAIAMAAHGPAGVVARLAMTTPDQIPPRTVVSRTANAPVPTAARTDGGCASGLCILVVATWSSFGRMPGGTG